MSEIEIEVDEFGLVADVGRFKGFPNTAELLASSVRDSLLRPSVLKRLLEGKEYSLGFETTLNDTLPPGETRTIEIWIKSRIKEAMEA